MVPTTGVGRCCRSDVRVSGRPAVSVPSLNRLYNRRSPLLQGVPVQCGCQEQTRDTLPGWLEARAEELDVVVLFEVDTEWENPVTELAGLFRWRRLSFVTIRLA